MGGNSTQSMQVPDRVPGRHHVYTSRLRIANGKNVAFCCRLIRSWRAAYTCLPQHQINDGNT